MLKRAMANPPTQQVATPHRPHRTGVFRTPLMRMSRVTIDVLWRLLPPRPWMAQPLLQQRAQTMTNRTYIELVLSLFAFISFCLAMMATGPQVIVFAAVTLLLMGWMPFRPGPMNRVTRAVSIALSIAALARVVIHFLPNVSI